jgi:hypothetical protein
MDKNRILGLPGRTSEQMIAKSTALKDRGGKSGGRAAKAVGLTSGESALLSRKRDWGRRKAVRPQHRSQQTA